MEVTGKITRVFEVITGNSSKGMWSKQDFLIEQPGRYLKPVCCQLWGEELITKYDLVVGLTVTAHINLESREYSGRWYTDVKAWKITWDEQQKRTWQPGGEAKKGAAASEDRPNEEKYEKENLGSGPIDDSLPF